MMEQMLATTNFLWRGALLICLLGFRASEAATAWSVTTGTPKCSGAFTVSNVAFTCNNTQQCGFGSTVKLTGYLMATQNLPEPAHITAHACLLNMCRTIIDRSNVDICENNVLVPQKGQTCPSLGLYKLSSTFDLPTNGNVNLLSGYTIKIVAKITGSSSRSWKYSTTTCTVQAKAVHVTAKSYQLSWGSFTAASLILLLGAYGLRRRRRSMAQIDLEDADEQLPSSDYELSQKHPKSHVTMLV